MIPRKGFELAGQKIGRLFVVRMAENRGPKLERAWECVCDCGKTIVKTTAIIRHSKFPSCGCWGKEVFSSKTTRRLLVHGMSNTPTGSSWMHMISRCYNKSYDAFKYYGGRGIIACDFIKSSPINLVLTIGERPHKTTLDRKNNSLGYFCGACAQCQSMDWPVNIRWATQTEQNRNKRGNVLYQIGVDVKCGSEWAEETGVSPLTISRKWNHMRVEKKEVSIG